jgi:predicted TIM-barrel fold metal-dependent hydrolase
LAVVISPARTWILLGVLGAVAAAAAIAISTAAARVRPAGAFGLFGPPELARVDVHQHVLPSTIAEAVRLARAQGIQAIVNVQGGTADGGLPRQLEAAAVAGGRVVVFAQLDPAGCCDAAWTERERRRVGAAKELGARGLAVTWSSSPIVGDPATAAIWEECAQQQLPVLVHVADREAFAAAALRHPATTFIGAHFAGSAEDPAWVARLLERAPNVFVDTAARLPDLGARAGAVRDLVLAHPDRVLFGSDLQYVEVGDIKAVVFGAGMPGGREEMLRFFEGTWRFFETRDREIPSPTPATGAHSIEGLGLPRAVLQKVYRDNAARVLGLTIPREERE